jgi:16S rRNA (uracil1498-N3)-methyltransferase
MKRLWVAQLGSGRLTVAGDAFHHLAHVLRARTGEEIVLFDGGGRQARAHLVGVGDAALDLEVGAVEVVPRAAEITLLVALLKADKLDLVVQKTTELGVARIVPLATERGVVRMADERRAGRLERWRRIAREAARQCGRADVPEVTSVVDLADAVAAAPIAPLRVILHEEPGQPRLRALAATPPGASVAAVGPEGGFTAAEIATAKGAGFAVASLGSRVLRAETAAVVTVALLAHLAGDLA